MMEKRLLSIVYLVFTYIMLLLKRKASVNCMPNLDRAIEQSQHYTKLKESSIAQLKELIHRRTIREIAHQYLSLKSIQNISPIRAILLWLIFNNCVGSEGRIAGLKLLD